MCRIRSGRAAVRGVRSRYMTSPAVSGTATTPSSAARLGGAAVATMPGATGRVSSTPTRWVVGMGRTPSSRRGRVRCHIVDGRRRARNAFPTPHASPPVVSPAICHVAPRARQGRRLRPPLGTMRVSVSRVSSAFISIRWAQGSIVSCVSGDIQASRATFPSQGHERAPPDRLRPRACPSAWALVDVWAWMAAGQNAHGARWIATYQAAEIVATEALQRRRRRLRESEALLTLHHPIGGC